MSASRLGRDSTQDIPGAVSVTAGLALLVYAISKAPDHGWASGWTLSRILAAVLLLVAFLVIETRAKHPLMPFSIFRIRTVAGANVAGLLLGGVVFANFFILTLYLQQVLHYSAIKTGLTFVATAGSAVLFAGLAQALRHQARGQTGDGGGLHRADRRAWFWYTQIPVHASFASDLLPGYLLVGFGLPFTFIPVSIAALAGIEYYEAGLASGLISTAQQIGGAIGVAIASSVQLSRYNHLVQKDGFGKAFTSGSQFAFWIMVGVSVAGLLATLVLVRGADLAAMGVPEPAEAPA